MNTQRQTPWRARCVERRTPGSASGLGKRTESNLGTAPQADSPAAIEAHLTIVVTAMAASLYIEHQIGWSIKKFVRAARSYRTVKITWLTNPHCRRPLPDVLREAIAKVLEQ
jgi:hypothetical protein